MKLREPEKERVSEISDRNNNVINMVAVSWQRKVKDVYIVRGASENTLEPVSTVTFRSTA